MDVLLQALDLCCGCVLMSQLTLQLCHSTVVTWKSMTRPLSRPHHPLGQVSLESPVEQVPHHVTWEILTWSQDRALLFVVGVDLLLSQHLGVRDECLIVTTASPLDSCDVRTTLDIQPTWCPRALYLFSSVGSQGHCFLVDSLTTDGQ